MNELQRFLFMLNRAKVPHRYERAEVDPEITPPGAFWKVTIEVGAAANGPVVGYGCFYTEFFFNEHGHLLQVGIWE
jgi:hypothetical protein